MKHLIYNIFLNLKWLCSNVFRCLIVALLVVLPSSILIVFPLGSLDYLRPFPTDIIYFFIGFAAILTTLLRFLGFLFKKIHPPLRWRDSERRNPKWILNLVLILPIVGLARTVLIDNGYPVDYFVWTELSSASLIGLLLLNRKVSNEDEALAKAQQPKITAENITPKQLKGMRIAGLVQSGLTFLFLILYWRADFKRDELEKELDYQVRYSEKSIQELEMQVGSLKKELEMMKQDSTTYPTQ